MSFASFAKDYTKGPGLNTNRKNSSKIAVFHIPVTKKVAAIIPGCLQAEYCKESEIIFLPGTVWKLEGVF